MFIGLTDQNVAHFRDPDGTRVGGKTLAAKLRPNVVQLFILLDCGLESNSK